MSKEFFSSTDLSSFNIRHTNSKDSSPIDVGGEPELLDVLNRKVVPLLESLQIAREALNKIAKEKTAPSLWTAVPQALFVITARKALSKINALMKTGEE